jgi:hypothetical protein
MNLWNRAIFDGLQNQDANAVARLSLIYFFLLAVSVGFGVGQTYVRMALQRRWLAWLNDSLADRWISNGRYYQLNLVRGDHANPEYRIADDVRIATESPIDFVAFAIFGGAWRSTAIECLDLKRLFAVDVRVGPNIQSRSSPPSPQCQRLGPHNRPIVFWKRRKNVISDGRNGVPDKLLLASTAWRNR